MFLFLISELLATYSIFTRNQVDYSGMNPETTPMRFSRYIQEMNLGAMRSFQANPDDLETDCYTQAQETNSLFNPMFDASNYTNGVINQAEFLELFQIMSFSMMEQFEYCGINQLLILIDGAMSDLPNTLSALSSIGTQLYFGWENRDTSIYLAFADIEDACLLDNKEECGYGIGLFVGQTLKY